MAACIDSETYSCYVQVVTVRHLCLVIVMAANDPAVERMPVMPKTILKSKAISKVAVWVVLGAVFNVVTCSSMRSGAF